MIQAILLVLFGLIASILVANGEKQQGQNLARAENPITSTTNRAGRPSLQRSSGQRNLFADTGPELDSHTGRPRLLRTAGQRHLLLTRDSLLEPTKTKTKRRLQDRDQNQEEEKSTLGSFKETYDEVMTIDETPPGEWTSAQKWGVAIGVLVAFLAVSCLWRCLCCK